MKYFLLLATLFFYNTLSAQVKQKPGVKVKQSNDGKEQVTKPIVSPRIHLMAPDNMACLVPDMTQVTPMPNSVTADQKIQFIPNAYKTKPEVALNKKKAKKKSDN